MRRPIRTAFSRIACAALAAAALAGFFAFPAAALGAPADISARAAGISSVDLTWGAVPGAAEYRVFRSGAPDGGFAEIATVTGTAYTDSGLSGAATYYYKVAAADGSGSGSESGVAAASTHVTVRFDMTGGALDYPATAAVPYGGTAPNPGNPRRTGYVFKGWSSPISGAGYFGFSEPLTADITLSAVWGRVYSVTFYRNHNAGDSVTASGDSLEETAAVALPGIAAVGAENADWTRPGYTFLGWSRSPDGGVIGSAAVSSENVHLYAQYGVNQYTVTFDYGGRAAAVSESYDFGSLLRQPPSPRDSASAIFTGWEYGGRPWDFGSDTLPDSDITLTAVWGENAMLHSVTFDDGTGGTFQQRAERSTKLTRPADPARAGYLFSGWAMDGELWDFESDTMPDRDVTLTAVWTEDSAAGETPPEDKRPDFETQIAAQTGNLFTDIQNGRLPLGAPLPAGCWSVVSGIAALLSSALMLILLSLMLFCRRSSGFRIPTIRLRGLFAVLVGFAAVAAFIFTQNQSLPAVYFTPNTLLVGSLLFLQCAIAGIFFRKGLSRGEWLDYDDKNCEKICRESPGDV